MAIAHQEERILLTDDRDFGDLVFRHVHPHAGVIYFRLSSTLLPIRLARLDAVLANYPNELDQFIVVTDRTVRARRVPQLDDDNQDPSPSVSASN